MRTLAYDRWSFSNWIKEKHRSLIINQITFSCILGCVCFIGSTHRIWEITEGPPVGSKKDLTGVGLKDTGDRRGEGEVEREV